ncbi:helix-turn-helix domain-containing protein [Paenibacillus sp. PL2-23]|uniref:helix-turn-helix domain-containing protein n=1 Tax=Paenibacillus sp. PL2-23 TaxID=2100729 RepID=UPI0030FAB922
MSTYFMRLLIYGLFLSIFPMVLLGYFAYHNSAASILNKVTNSNQQLLAQTEISIEQNLKIIERSVVQFSNLPIMDKLSNTALHERNFQVIRDASLNLEYMFTKELGIESIYYINMKHNWAIYPGKTFQLNQHQTDAYQLLLQQLKFKSSILLDNHLGQEPLIHNTQLPRGIWHIQSVPANVWRSPMGLLAVKISESKWSEWIAKSQSFNTLFIINKEKQVLASNDNKNIPDRLDIPFLEQYPDTPSGFTRGEFQGEDVYFFYKKSEFTNWTYISIVPKSVIHKDSRWIGWVTLMICCGLIIIMVALSFTGAVKIHNPIRKISSLIEKKKPGSRTYDELEYIESALKNMKQQIISQGIHLNKYYVFQLLSSGMLRNEIQEKILDHHQQLQFQEQYALIAIQIDTLTNSRFKESDRELLIFILMNILEEVIPSSMRLSSVVMNQSLICILGLKNQDANLNKGTILIHAQNTLEKIREYTKLSVSAGVSTTFTDLIDAPSALKEAMNALKYRVRFGNQSLLFIEDVEPSSNRNPIDYPEYLSIQLTDAIKLNEPEKADDALHRFIQLLFQNNHLSLTDYQMILIRLLNDIVRLYQPDNENANLILDGQSLPRELMELQTANEIESWFKHRVITPSLRLIEEKNERQHQRISEQMLLLIQNETEPTLESISTKLNYSPGYLGLIFRKEQGVPFSEYVKYDRINKAKEILIQSDVAINEISTQLNYKNTQNFIRSFKKETGLTPGQYRAMRKSKDNEDPN